MPEIKLEPEDSPADRKGEKVNGLTFHYDCKPQDGGIVYFVEGKEVFRAFFHAENFANVFFEKLKPNPVYLAISEEQRRRVYDAVREDFAKAGEEVTDEQLGTLEPEALRKMSLEILKQSIVIATKRANDNLPSIVAMILERVMYATLYAGANDLRDILEVPKQKFSAKEIREAIFQPEWERLKNIAGATTGGARNVKHVWTDEQRECLVSNYERLKPIWAEAKRIAVSAQKSRESTRNQRWQEEVKGAYPELPDELIERLSAPRSAEAKPSDIALTHAASLCIPVSYSLRRLRDELKQFRARQFKSSS